MTEIPAHYVASACTGKHPCASWDAAQATLRRTLKTRDIRGEDRPVLRVYRCPNCRNGTSAAAPDRKARPALPRHNTRTAPTMKLTMIALLTTFAFPALAYTPSQGVTFEEFVTARGCVLIEVEDSNALTFKGGCPAAAEFMATSGGNLVDTDDDPSTAPEWVSNR